MDININFVTGKKFIGSNGTTLSIFLKKLPVLNTHQEKMKFLSDFQEMIAIGHIGKIISYDFHTNKEHTKSYAFIDLQLYNTTRALIFKKAVSSTPYKISMNGIEIANYISKEERKKINDRKKAEKKAKREEKTKREETYTFGYIDKWVEIEGQDDTQILVPTCNGIEEKDWTPEMKNAFEIWEETQYNDYIDEDDHKEWDERNEETFGNCDPDYDYADEEADLKTIANLCSFLSLCH